MALQIDTSAPLLRPSQLTDLVRAVVGADPHDEHRWIEWKSTLDLTTTAGQSHVAKVIIGLANRQPAAAGRWTGGYGYLLVGVEPGAINGVVTVDPEKLVGKIRAYVGDAIGWAPEYVIVDGKQVLVVIVDPPQPGDPIHFLRKQIEKFQACTIFVRHTGRTDPVTPAEFDMLQARLLERTPSLQMAVTATPPTIEVVPDVIGVVDQWVEQRRPVLLAARHQPTPRQTLAGDPMYPLKSAFNVLRSEAHPDPRTEEQYADEVEQFLGEASNFLVNRGLWDLHQHGGASLRLTVNNPTDLGYTGLRLKVHVPGRVKSYPEGLVDAVEGERPDVPRPPKPLGTPTITANSLYNQFHMVSQIPMPGLPVFSDPGPGFTIRDTGSVTIEYDDFELRPGETVTLDPVPLLVDEDPGVTLSATWSATAAQVRGRLTGELTITVGVSTLDLANLDKDRKADE